MFGVPIVSVIPFGLSFVVHLGEREEMGVELPVFVLLLRVLAV